MIYYFSYTDSGSYLGEISPLFSWDSDFPYYYDGQALFRLSNDQTLLNKVGSIINDTLEFNFAPMMLFIATWNRLPESGGSQNNV